MDSSSGKIGMSWFSSSSQSMRSGKMSGEELLGGSSSAAVSVIIEVLLSLAEILNKLMILLRSSMVISRNIAAHFIWLHIYFVDQVQVV